MPEDKLPELPLDWAYAMVIGSILALGMLFFNASHVRADELSAPINPQSLAPSTHASLSKAESLTPAPAQVSAEKNEIALGSASNKFPAKAASAALKKSAAWSKLGQFLLDTLGSGDPDTPSYVVSP